MTNIRPTLDHPGAPLTPRQMTTVALHQQFPHKTWAEVAEIIGVSTACAQNYWYSALLRLGREPGDEGFDLRAAVMEGKAEKKKVERKQLGDKFLEVADAFIDGFGKLQPDKIKEMIEAHPQRAMITAAVAVDKADKLHDRPDQILLIRDVRKLDDQAALLLEEYERRSSETIDVPASDTVSIPAEVGSESIPVSEVLDSQKDCIPVEVSDA